MSLKFNGRQLSWSVLDRRLRDKQARDIVGQYFDSSNRGRSRGFLKTEKGFSQLDFPGGDTVATKLTGINSEGNIVGLHSVPGGPPLAPAQGFIHDGAHFNGYTGAWRQSYTLINGINDSDDLVGETSDTGGFGGFLYAHNGFSHISFPGNFFVNTAPWAINNLGTIVGTIDCDGGGCESGFMYKDGEYTQVCHAGNKCNVYVAYRRKQSRAPGRLLDRQQFGTTRIRGDRWTFYVGGLSGCQRQMATQQSLASMTGMRS